MTTLVRNSIRFLISFNILIAILGYGLIRFFSLDIHLADIIIPSLVFTVISSVTILIFSRGQRRDPESQTFHSLIAIGLKFLLEMIFALCWFIIAKKTSLEFIIIFFVLYLCLSLFTIGAMLKTLRNKAL